jgi:hypothetical protein
VLTANSNADIGENQTNSPGRCDPQHFCGFPTALMKEAKLSILQHSSMSLIQELLLCVSIATCNLRDKTRTKIAVAH